MDVQGTVWAYMNVQVQSWAYMDVQGTVWAYMNVQVQSWAYMDVQGTVMGIYECAGYSPGRT